MAGWRCVELSRKSFPAEISGGRTSSPCTQFIVIVLVIVLLLVLGLDVDYEYDYEHEQVQEG